MKKFIISGTLVSILALSPLTINAKEAEPKKYNAHHDHQNHFERHHKEHHRNHFMEKHQQEVIQYLSTYLNQPSDKLTKLVTDQKLRMKELIFVSAISKLSNKPIEDVIAKKKTLGFEELLKSYNITKEQLFTEMKTIHKGIKEKIKPAQQHR